MPIVKAQVTELVNLVERPEKGPAMFDHLAYAQKVVDDKEHYNRFYRAVCKQHLADYKRYCTGKNAGRFYTFDENAPFRVLKFAWFCWIVVGEDGDVIHFDPLPWQQFLIYMLFGWKIGREDKAGLERKPGTRRYRKVYLETAKGSGKTPLVAMLGMVFAEIDKLPNGKFESQPRVYVCASTQIQAYLTIDFMETAIEHSKELASRFIVSQAQTANRFIKKVGTANRQPVVSTFAYTGKTGLSGPTPSFNIIEELHEHTDNKGMVMLEKGIKRRLQGCTFITTNAGELADGFAWDEHKYSKDVAVGIKKNDYYLPFVFCIEKDRGDDPFDQSCWGKANPSLGTTIRMDYLLKEWNDAQRSPDLLRDFTRLNLGIWPETSTVPFVGRDVVEDCEKLAIPTKKELESWLVFLGLDLAPLKDLSALAACFVSPDFAKMYLEVIAYCAADSLPVKQTKMDAPFNVWAEQGLVIATPGRALDYGVIVDDIAGYLNNFNVVGLAYDDYDMTTFCKFLDAADIEYGPEADYELTIVNHPQGHRRQNLDKKGLTMGGSINCIESRMITQPPTIAIKENPLFRLACQKAEIEKGAYGSRVFVRAKGGKSTFGYIDPLVAGAMAVGFADTLGVDDPSHPRKAVSRDDMADWTRIFAEGI